jgi:acetyltransferase
MSAQSRYFRFLHPISELSPETIARFTQLDYAREMALIALTPDEKRFAGIARYYPDLDRTSAEFAIAIADDWQGLGLGRILLESLISAARQAGYRQIHGTVLNDNSNMLKLAGKLGFNIDPGRPTINAVTVSFPLA